MLESSLLPREVQGAAALQPHLHCGALRRKAVPCLEHRLTPTASSQRTLPALTLLFSPKREKRARAGPARAPPRQVKCPRCVWKGPPAAPWNNKPSSVFQ